MHGQTPSYKCVRALWQPPAHDAPARRALLEISQTAGGTRQRSGEGGWGIGYWGWGIGGIRDWGIGDWGGSLGGTVHSPITNHPTSPITSHPNPQSPIPNPQSPRSEINERMNSQLCLPGLCGGEVVKCLAVV